MGRDRDRDVQEVRGEVDIDLSEVVSVLKEILDELRKARHDKHSDWYCTTCPLCETENVALRRR